MYSHGSCANTPSIFLKEQFPYVSMIHLKKDSEASYIISIALPSKHVPQLCFLAYLVLLSLKRSEEKSKIPQCKLLLASQGLQPNSTWQPGHNLQTRIYFRICRLPISVTESLQEKCSIKILYLPDGSFWNVWCSLRKQQSTGRKMRTLPLYK